MAVLVVLTITDAEPLAADGGIVPEATIIFAMLCQLYRADIPTLLSALTDPELIARWQQAVAEETPMLADRPLLAHLKRLMTTASRFMSSGFDSTARHDLASADALLSDLFAVATWNDWALPIERQVDQEVDITELNRGFLSADTSDGAGLWLLDHGTIAFSRQRQASDQADWTGHVRSC